MDLVRKNLVFLIMWLMLAATVAYIVIESSIDKLFLLSFAFVAWSGGWVSHYLLEHISEDRKEQN